MADEKPCAFQAIGWYERGVPEPLKPSGGNSSEFHVYSITYDIMNKGWDDMCHSACEFLLLNPKELDAEVANMSIALNLPGGADAVATFDAHGTLVLHSEQVHLARQFKRWIFSFVLGKCLYQSNKGVEGYYILPLKISREKFSDINVSHLVDWNLVKSAISSGAMLKKGKNCNEFHENGDEKECVLIEAGFLKLQNGSFTQIQLMDGIITAAHDGMSYCIASVLDEINIWSDLPDRNDNFPCNYMDYYREKFGYDLKHEAQPLLQASKLYRSSDYLRQRLLHPGDVCTKRMEKVNLPPELCTLHAGIKGNLWRGAVRLPSVLHHLEKTLLASELRDHIGIPISCFKILEALTSGACDVKFSYEQLEILGDSFLKFTASIYLYQENHELGKESLGTLLFNLVCDKSLFHYAVARNLQVYVFAESVSIKDWTPPGLLVGSNEQITDGYQPREECLKMQKVSYRTLADVVEALIAAYLVYGNMSLALKAMQWLEFPFHFPTKWCGVQNYGLTGNINNAESVSIDQLERKLGYHFENDFLLVSALHSEDEIIFERMDFLGDALICFIVTYHLTILYPKLNVGKINDIRQAIVSIENLACVVLRHNLHKVFKQAFSIRGQGIIEFLNYLRRGHFEMEELNAYCKERKTVFKAFGGRMRALAAAIFLDSGLDINCVWKVFRDLLSPLVTPDTLTSHPMTQLEVLCKKDNLELKITNSQSSTGIFHVKILVNEMMIASFEDENRRTARRVAAIKALYRLTEDISIFPEIKDFGV